MGVNGAMLYEWTVKTEHYRCVRMLQNVWGWTGFACEDVRADIVQKTSA